MGVEFRRSPFFFYSASWARTRSASALDPTVALFFAARRTVPEVFLLSTSSFSLFPPSPEVPTANWLAMRRAHQVGLPIYRLYEPGGIPVEGGGLQVHPLVASVELGRGLAHEPERDAIDGDQPLLVSYFGEA